MAGVTKQTSVSDDSPGFGLLVSIETKLLFSGQNHLRLRNGSSLRVTMLA